MTINDKTVSDMIKAIETLTACVSELLEQLSQYESLEETEGWLPELEKAEEYCDEFGFNMF